MDRKRIQRLRRALREEKLDALVLRLPENIVMALGVWPMNGFSYAVVTAEAGPLALIAPSCEDEEMDGCWADHVRYFTWPRLRMPDPLEAIADHLRDIARTHGLTRARLGYEGSFDAVAPPHNTGEVMVNAENSVSWLKSVLPRAHWVDATDLLYAQRATKTEDEVARLRVAHQVAGYGLRSFRRAVDVGVRETDLAATVYGAVLTRGQSLRGVRHVNVFPQVSSGPNAHRAWRPVVTTGNRRLRHGDITVLELAVCVDGFWADVTRVRCAGKPSPELRRAFAAVRVAQAAALAAVKAGTRASIPDEVSYSVLREAGFEDQITHLTGHGLGFRYHEPEPFLIQGNPMKLRVGHVCSVEPGLYSKAWGGVRLEDNVVVTRDGCEVLTTAPKGL